MKTFKRLTCLLLALILCLGLTACGESGPVVTVTNSIDGSIEEFNISQPEDETWGDNRIESAIGSGKSAKADATGVDEMDATDVRITMDSGEYFYFNDAVICVGDEVELRYDEYGDLVITVSNDDSTYDVQESSNTSGSITGGYESELEGTWVWAYGDSFISFDGVDSFSCESDGHEVSGSYAYDGGNITFTVTGGNDELAAFFTDGGYLDSDGDLVLNNEDFDGYFIRKDGSSAYEPSGYESQLIGDWYHISGRMAMEFNETGEVYMGNNVDELILEYNYDGNTIDIVHPDSGDSITGHLDGDGNLHLDILGGWFMYEDEVSGGYIYSDTNFDYTEIGDGKARYTDYDRNIRLTCPTYYTVLTCGLDVGTDTVVVADGENGYVIADNLTGEWLSSPLDKPEFLQAYFDDYFGELFGALYGEWTDGEIRFQENRYDDWLGYLTGNYWNDNFDISVEMIIYKTSSDSFIFKCFVAPYGNDEQMSDLWDDVRGIDCAS